MANQDNQNNQNSNGFNWTRNKIIAAGVGVFAIVGTAVAVPAIADTKMVQHAQVAMFDGENVKVHTAGWGGHKRGGFAEMSKEDLEKRVTKMVRHLSIEIEATDEQEQKIIDVALSTAVELQPLRDEYHAAGEKMALLLTADSVDRTAIETLRAERLSATDDVSKTIVDAVADVSEILTVEQRQGLSERLEKMKARFHR